MTHKPPRWLSPLMLAVLMLLVAGCATPLPPSPPTVPASPRLPALPPQARQPEPPATCLPSCSAGLMTLRESLRRMLTEPERQGLPASGPTTP